MLESKIGKNELHFSIKCLIIVTLIGMSCLEEFVGQHKGTINLKQCGKICPMQCLKSGMTKQQCNKECQKAS